MPPWTGRCASQRTQKNPKTRPAGVAYLHGQVCVHHQRQQQLRHLLLLPATKNRAGWRQSNLGQPASLTAQRLKSSGARPVWYRKKWLLHASWPVLSCHTTPSERAGHAVAAGLVWFCLPPHSAAPRLTTPRCSVTCLPAYAMPRPRMAPIRVWGSSLPT